MIRVRDDDVLVNSSKYACSLDKLKMVHDWICEVPDSLIHVPTILVTEIQQFPDAIEFVRQETLEGRMAPELHGLEHKNYADLTHDEIVAELQYCQEWMLKTFDVTITKFYTPWGAGADAAGAHIAPATESAGLEWVGVNEVRELPGQEGVVSKLRQGHTIDYLGDREIMIHWWESGQRMKRVVKVIKHGSWEEAKKQNRRLF